MNDQLGGMWEETVIPYSNTPYQHLPKGTLIRKGGVW
jgi:hypothetical protein